MDGGVWYATIHGVSKSRTRLSNFTFTFTMYWQLYISISSFPTQSHIAWWLMGFPFHK